jgi:hypothetical protein
MTSAALFITIAADDMVRAQEGMNVAVHTTLVTAAVSLVATDEARAAAASFERRAGLCRPAGAEFTDPVATELSL